jgi:hypothetical protein
MGLLSLPVKMQPVVRALTAGTLSFIPNTTSSIDAIVPVGPQGGRANARPRRALAMAIAELRSGEPKQKVR